MNDMLASTGLVSLSLASCQESKVSSPKHTSRRVSLMALVEFFAAPRLLISILLFHFVEGGVTLFENFLS
jgi:hypothetical protein